MGLTGPALTLTVRDAETSAVHTDWDEPWPFRSGRPHAPTLVAVARSGRPAQQQS